MSQAEQAAGRAAHEPTGGPQERKTSRGRSGAGTGLRARRAGEASWRRGMWGPLLVAPAVVLFVGYIAWPVVSNLGTSFLGNSEADPTLRFVGFDNFMWIGTTRPGQLAFRNVALFAVMTIPVQMILGLYFAVALSGRGWVKGLLRTLLFLPVVLTPVVIGYLFADLLETSNGPVNEALRAVGLDWLAQPWLADPMLALPVVAAVNVWMWTGFSMAIYQAALTSLDDEVLEAAALDGASHWQTLWRVIAPMLRPAHYALLILGVIATLKVFDLVYVLTGGGPDSASEVPTSLLLKSLLAGHEGRAAALGTVVFLLAMLLTIAQLRRYGKGDDQ